MGGVKYDSMGAERKVRGVASMACPEGLEPPTCCLEGSCSIQLSYGQKEILAWRCTKNKARGHQGSARAC